MTEGTITATETHADSTMQVLTTVLTLDHEHPATRAMMLTPTSPTG